MLVRLPELPSVGKADVVATVVEAHGDEIAGAFTVVTSRLVTYPAGWMVATLGNPYSFWTPTCMGTNILPAVSFSSPFNRAP